MSTLHTQDEIPGLLRHSDDGFSAKDLKMVLARTPVFLSVLINSSTLCHADIISKQRQREAGIGLSSKTWACLLQ